MSARAPLVGTATTRARSGTGFLYGWLLVALFIEYARPTNQLTFLEFPFFYSLVPMSLLLVQSLAQGLRPLKEIFSDRISKWLLILFGVVACSWIANGFGADGSTVAQSVLGYVFLFILIARLVTTATRLRGVIVALTLAHFYLLAINFNVLTDPTQRQYLVGGTFLGDGNDFSLSICILIPCMIEIAKDSRNKFGRMLAWASVGLIILAIVATQSRGGTLGIAAVMLYLWWRSPRKVVAAVAIALVGGLVLAYAPAQYFQRMSTVTTMSIDGSAQGRLDAWAGSIGMGAHNPVFGIGAGNFGGRWGQTAHSTYFLALAELGIPGFICVLVIVFGNMKQNARLRRQLLASEAALTRPRVQESARLLDLTNAGLVGYAVAGAFLSTTYYPHLYVITGLLVCARSFASAQETFGTNASNASGPEVGTAAGRSVRRGR